MKRNQMENERLVDEAIVKEYPMFIGSASFRWL